MSGSLSRSVSFSFCLYCRVGAFTVIDVVMAPPHMFFMMWYVCAKLFIIIADYDCDYSIIYAHACNWLTDSVCMALATINA